MARGGQQSRQRSCRTQRALISLLITIGQKRMTLCHPPTPCLLRICSPAGHQIAISRGQHSPRPSSCTATCKRASSQKSSHAAGVRVSNQQLRLRHCCVSACPCSPVGLPTMISHGQSCMVAQTRQLLLLQCTRPHIIRQLRDRHSRSRCSHTHPPHTPISVSSSHSKDINSSRSSSQVQACIKQGGSAAA